MTTSCGTGVDGLQGPLFQIDVSEIIVHECWSYRHPTRSAPSNSSRRRPDCRRYPARASGGANWVRTTRALPAPLSGQWSVPPATYACTTWRVNPMPCRRRRTIAFLPSTGRPNRQCPTKSARPRGRCLSPASRSIDGVGDQSRAPAQISREPREAKEQSVVARRARSPRLSERSGRVRYPGRDWIAKGLAPGL